MERLLPVFLLAMLAGCTTTGLSNLMVKDQTEISDEATSEEEMLDHTSARWECGNLLFTYNMEKLILTIQLGNEDYGTVMFDGNTIPTMFQLKGLDRRWEWIVQEEQDYGYAIILTPDNLARYYDFSGEESTQSSQTWMCYKK
jgi:hypothetical protein